MQRCDWRRRSAGSTASCRCAPSASRISFSFQRQALGEHRVAFLQVLERLAGSHRAADELGTRDRRVGRLVELHRVEECGAELGLEAFEPSVLMRQRGSLGANLARDRLVLLLEAPPKLAAARRRPGSADLRSLSCARGRGCGPASCRDPCGCNSARPFFGSRCTTLNVAPVLRTLSIGGCIVLVDLIEIDLGREAVGLVDRIEMAHDEIARRPTRGMQSDARADPRAGRAHAAPRLVAVRLELALDDRIQELEQLRAHEIAPVLRPGGAPRR